MEARRAALITLAAACLFTAAVVAVPSFPLPVRDPPLHVALETTAAWVSLAAALLVAGRVRRRRRLVDVLLLAAFAQSGLVNLLLSALPTVVGGTTWAALSMWGGLVGRFLASLSFAAAALAGDRELPPHRWVLRVAGACLLLTAVIAGIVTGFADILPRGVGTTVDGTVGRVGVVPTLPVHPVIHAAQLAMALAYGLAVVGFLRRSDRSDDPLLPWLSSAAVLSAFARIHYFLLPSLYTGVVYSGDILRIAFHVLLLGGVAAELRATSQALATAAAGEERRRIARDLHDGLAQELSFLTTQSAWFARRHADDPRAALLASSAQRALDESRRAIDTLAGTSGLALPFALVRAVEEVAARYQQRVAFRVDDTIDVPPATGEDLIRIAREAVANAARHGAPGLVTVTLEGGARLLLEVADDGGGFDADAARDGRFRFGLQSMRERAEAMGGTCVVESARAQGTTVRAEVPWTS